MHGGDDAEVVALREVHLEFLVNVSGVGPFFDLFENLYASSVAEVESDWMIVRDFLVIVSVNEAELWVAFLLSEEDCEFDVVFLGHGELELRVVGPSGRRLSATSGFSFPFGFDLCAVCPWLQRCDGDILLLGREHYQSKVSGGVLALGIRHNDVKEVWLHFDGHSAIAAMTSLEVKMMATSCASVTDKANWLDSS